VHCFVCAFLFASPNSTPNSGAFGLSDCVAHRRPDVESNKHADGFPKFSSDSRAIGRTVSSTIGESHCNANSRSFSIAISSAFNATNSSPLSRTISKSYRSTIGDSVGGTIGSAICNPDSHPLCFALNESQCQSDRGTFRSTKLYTNIDTDSGADTGTLPTVQSGRCWR
jgi:hypothetical protein